MRFVFLLFTFLWGFEMQKGFYVTANYENKDEIQWAKNFKIAEIGGIEAGIPKSVFTLLKENNVTVLGYDWMPAIEYYLNSLNLAFSEFIHKNRYKYTLNPDGPFINCNTDCRDYYLDFTKNVIKAKTSFLLTNLKKGFDGVFFDWASGNFINEDEFKQIKNNYIYKHKKFDYLEKVADFYAFIKSRIFFVTNQAYRNERVLKFVPYDMAESYIVGVDKNKTNFYPLGDFNTTVYNLEYLKKLKEKYKKYGFKNFILMNYAKNKPKEAVYYAYAMAKVFGFESYTEVLGDRDKEREDLYFYDLGKAKNLIKTDGFFKEYDNGYVIVIDTNDTFEIEFNKRVYDVFNKRWVDKIKLYNDSHPIGRVYLKEKK